MLAVSGWQAGLLLFILCITEVSGKDTYISLQSDWDLGDDNDDDDDDDNVDVGDEDIPNI